jgi:acyl-CoA thioester hydrolase
LLDPSLFHFSTEVRVRLPETDAMGIVFHGYFFTYLEVGRMDYLRNLGLADGVRPIKGFSNLVRKVECDFVSPARFDDLLVIHVRLAEIKTSSFRFEFLIKHKVDNRTVAHGQSVHVAVDDATFRPIRVPDDFRTRIQSFEKDIR